MNKPRILSRTNRQELANKLPLVEVAGHNRILIENHKGVIGYSTEEIQIKVCYGRIVLTGCKLSFSQINREQLVVTGEIRGITLYRG